MSWDYIGQQLKVGGEIAFSGQLAHTAMHQSQPKGDWEQMDADALEGKSSAAEQEARAKARASLMPYERQWQQERLQSQQMSVVARAAFVAKSEAVMDDLMQAEKDSLKRQLSSPPVEFDCISKRRRIRQRTNEERVRMKLTMELLALTLRDYFASLTGRRLQSCMDTEDRVKVVSHCLVTKKTNTLSTLMCPLRVYLAWADVKLEKFAFAADDDPWEEEWHYGGWPPTESQAYEHVLELENASMFLESLAFLQFTLGFQFDHLFSSSRIYLHTSHRFGRLGPSRKAARRSLGNYHTCDYHVLPEWRKPSALDEGMKERVLTDDVEMPQVAVANRDHHGEPDSDEEAIRIGLVINRASGRVHVCGNGADQATLCGLPYSARFELKQQLNEFDLKCANCFRMSTIKPPSAAGAASASSSRS